MVSIEIDNHIYQVPEGSNLLQACLSLGLDLPYFCWHPSLGSVGACRQCAVIQYHDRHDEVEGDQRDEQGRLVMSCMTLVSEGMRISIDAKNARDFRSDIIELLMTNHPHDCPVCEEGGECHLQDMTQMSGHTYRRYRGKKRTHRNQYLGPFINHEMNRCIACYRCVRYYQDYAGGHDLQAMASHNHVYFGRHEDGVLENEFSGNLVEVCPTGVFTDRTLSQHYTRKWDLQAAPSICVHCAQGCNTSPGERYGELRRIVNRYNGAVNGYFLCDRGRFGYGFVNSDDRVTQAERLRITEHEPQRETLSRPETRDALLDAVGSGKRLLGIGSPRASVEANFALRELVGEEHFYSGLNGQQLKLQQSIIKILSTRPVRVPELSEVEQADVVLILGEDVINTSPRLALSLRQTAANIGDQLADDLRIPRWQDAAVREAMQSDKTPIFIAAMTATRIDDIAQKLYRDKPAGIAQLGFAIASAIDSTAPFPEQLSEVQQSLAQEIAAVLKAAKNPLIVSGVGCQSQAVIAAAANVATALANRNGAAQPTNLFYCLPECNSMGIGLMGSAEDEGLEQAVERLELNQVDTLIVLENDLYRRLPPEQVKRIFASEARVIVLDYIKNETALKANLLLPAATFAETEGTLVSGSGRAQRTFAVYVPAADIRGSWEWLSDMQALRNAETEPRWQHLDEVTKDCADAIEALRGIVDAAPDAAFRMAGMKIARQPHRYSGRTAMRAAVNVSEPKQAADHDSALAFSMEGYPGEKPSALTPYYWSPGWNSNQSIGKFQEEINGPLKGGDPGVRLLEAPNESSKRWFDTSPDSVSGQGDWLMLPSYHIFGSEELSALSEAIAERSPLPTVMLTPEDAKTLGVEQGDGLVLSVSSEQLNLEVVISEGCPSGSLVVTAGLAKTAGLPFPHRVKAIRDENWMRRSQTNIFVSDRGSPT